MNALYRRRDPRFERWYVWEGDPSWVARLVMLVRRFWK